jgi:hypothetical protein
MHFEEDGVLWNQKQIAFYYVEFPRVEGSDKCEAKNELQETVD